MAQVVGWIVIAFVVLILAVAAAGGGGSTKSPKTSAASPTTAAAATTTISVPAGTPTTVAATTAPPTTSAPTTIAPTTTIPPTTTTTVASPKETTLSGTGQAVTQPFTAASSGLAILRAQCACGENFAVELDSAHGQMIDLPVNVIGAYTGSAVEQLAKGQSYILKITADAAWTVKIEEPTTRGARALPHTYSGTGQTVVGPFQGGDAIEYVAKNTSTGGGNFAVTLYNADGSEADLPFNEIGSFSGSTISNELNGGPYWMGIDSDGTWSIATSSP